MTVPVSNATKGPPLWRVVLAAAFVQNVSTGLLFGTFGTILFALEDWFRADRGQSSLTISLAVLTLSLTAAWMGKVIGRRPLRAFMILGCVMSAAGFGLLSIANDVWQLWGIYLLLLGPGAGFCGVLAANTLAASWADDASRGRALGWVNAPILVTIAPLASEAGLTHLGLQGFFLICAVLPLLMIPAVMSVHERVPAVEGAGNAPKGKRIIFTGLLFLLVLIIGVISGGGMLKVSHMIPLVTAQGHSFSSANWLISIAGLVGIFGSIIFGWIADRFGAAEALATNAALQAISWTILLIPVAYGWLILDAVIVGLCGGGLQAVIGTLLARLFGMDNFSRIYGLLSLLTLPFLFGIPWFAGLLFVKSGGYFLPISLQIFAFLAAAVGALAVARHQKQKVS
jgi:MFS family permease